jgi:hypothetical protein
MVYNCAVMPIHDWTKVDAGIFHDFHHEWISAIKGALNHGLLPKDHYALAEQRASGLGPDVLTLQRAKGSGPESNGPDQAQDVGGGVAVASAPPKVRFHVRMDDSRYYALRANRIVVRHVSGHRIIAVVEIMSPGNKSDEQALRDFVQKAWDVIASGVHLLIIDLFPPTSRDPNGIHDLIWGQGDVRVERAPGQLLTLASYMATYMQEAFVEPIAVNDALPEMPLFLSADHYVPVPLEQSYQMAFDAVPEYWRDRLMAPG